MQLALDARRRPARAGSDRRARRVHRDHPAPALDVDAAADLVWDPQPPAAPAPLHAPTERRGHRELLPMYVVGELDAHRPLRAGVGHLAEQLGAHGVPGGVKAATQLVEL